MQSSKKTFQSLQSQSKVAVARLLPKLEDVHHLPLPDSIKKNFLEDVYPFLILDKRTDLFLYYMCLQCQKPFSIHMTQYVECPYCSNYVLNMPIIFSHDFVCPACQELFLYDIKKCTKCGYNTIAAISRKLNFHVFLACLLSKSLISNDFSEKQKMNYHLECAFTLLRHRYCEDNIPDKVIELALHYMTSMYATLFHFHPMVAEKIFDMDIKKFNNFIRVTLFCLFYEIKRVNEIVGLLNIREGHYENRNDFWSHYFKHMNTLLNRPNEATFDIFWLRNDDRKSVFKMKYLLETKYL